MKTVQTVPPSLRGAVRVALVQLLLAALCWVGVGFLNARGTWLLERGQALVAQRLLLWEMPLIGLLGAVVLPVVLYLRLVREASGPGLLDSDFVKRALAFPQESAIAGLFTSVLVFMAAGFRLRAAIAAPATEAAKIAVLGLLTGNLLAVLSYFLLQPLSAGLVRNALERGALPPIAPSFSITKKILAACIGVMLLVAGFFGIVAVSWAQKYVEEEAAASAEQFLARVVRSATAQVPQGRAAWEAFLKGTKPPEGAFLYVLAAGGGLVTTYPAESESLAARLARSELLGSETRSAAGPLVVRWGDARIVVRDRIHDRETIGVIVTPDPAVLRGVLRTLAVLTAEALLAALLLAVVAGRGMTGPLRLLGRNASAYAHETDTPSSTLSIATDDEITQLGADLDRMAEVQRESRRRLQEQSRRDERDAVLARVAHEVRNPLFGISSTLSALEHELGPGKHADYFDVLRAEGQRLSRLIDEMLAAGPAAVSEPGSGDETPSPGPVRDSDRS